MKVNVLLNLHFPGERRSKLFKVKLEISVANYLCSRGDCLLSLTFIPQLQMHPNSSNAIYYYTFILIVTFHDTFGNSGVVSMKSSGTEEAAWDRSENEPDFKRDWQD